MSYTLGPGPSSERNTIEIASLYRTHFKVPNVNFLISLNDNTFLNSEEWTIDLQRTKWLAPVCPLFRGSIVARFKAKRTNVVNIHYFITLITGCEIHNYFVLCLSLFTDILFFGTSDTLEPCQRFQRVRGSKYI